VKPWHTVSFWVSTLLAVCVALVIVASFGLRPQARAFPLIVAVPTLAVLGLVIAGEFAPRLWEQLDLSVVGATSDEAGEMEAIEQESEQQEYALRDIPWRVVGLVLGSLVLFGVAVLLVGFEFACPLYLLLFTRAYSGAGWSGSVLTAAGITVSVIGLGWLFQVDLYPGVLRGANLPPF
jgi:hypothetical protein